MSADNHLAYKRFYTIESKEKPVLTVNPDDNQDA